MAYILLCLLAITAVSDSFSIDPCSGMMSVGSFTVEWEANEDDDYVQFTYYAETTNWVGLGFSLTANMVKYYYIYLTIVLIIIFALTIAKL